MRRALYITCVVLAAGCFIYAGVWFIAGQTQKSKDSRLAEQFHQAAAPVKPAADTPATDTADADSAGAAGEADAHFGPLSAINPDLTGWITIEGTAIDYPVVCGEDNERYLNTDFYGGASKRGSIFMDFRCAFDSRNLILYGHHMKDGSMFHDLARYQEPAFIEEHREIRLYHVNGEEEVYRVIDVLYWNADVSNSETFFEHISTLDYGGGKLLSLTTCIDTAGNSHLIVVAHKVA